MSEPTDAELAARRAKVLKVVRGFGLALVLIGIGVSEGAIALPRLVGLLIGLVGLYELFIFPLSLQRRWRKAGR